MDKQVNLKVLIVDDDEIAIVLHKFTLESSFLATQPIIALNGKQSLNYILNSEKDSDYFIFLDINMPDMNGWEFLDIIDENSLSNKVFVIILTSSINKRDREKAKKYPNIIDFMEKPIDEEEVEKVKNHPDIAPYFIK